MWPRDYLPIPYEPLGRSRSGVDCWGLVRLVYRDRLGIELPDWIYDGIKDARHAVAREVNSESWRQVQEPEAHDVALFQFCGHPLHLGVVIGPDMPGQMIHAMQGVGVSIEAYAGRRWKPRLCGFWRPAMIPQ